jgi:hypothetical protein
VGAAVLCLRLLVRIAQAWQALREGDLPHFIVHNGH